MLNQKFSVSVHIMSALAIHKDESKLLNSDILAQSIQTNPAVVRRIVAKLVEAGLVESYKGKSGGIKIAKDAEDITLQHIYLAVEEKPLIHSHSPSPKKQCKVSCCIHEIMNKVIDGFEKNSLDYLHKIKLSKIIHQVK